MTAAAFALAVLPSLLGLVWLLRGDPKRLRARRLARRPSTPAQRRRAAALVLLPGLVLGFAGQWAALLIWLAAVLAGGWLLAQVGAGPLQDARR